MGINQPPHRPLRGSHSRTGAIQYPPFLRLGLLTLLSPTHSGVEGAPFRSLLTATRLERALNLTQALLYRANSSLAPNCWACLSLSSSAYMALLIPLAIALSLTTHLAFTVQKEATFFERTDTLL